MGNESRQKETLRKNQKKIQEIKSLVTEMKKAFHRLINKMDMAKKRSCEPEDRSIETSTTEVGAEKKKEKY